MPVQKSRVSPSRRGMRRAHDALSATQLSTDPTPGETHLRHHVTAGRYYRGKQAAAPQTKRGPDALSAKLLSAGPTSGETHLRQHGTADGYYRGKQVVAPKTKIVEED